MRSELQRHLVKPYINIWMVIELLRSLGDAIDKCDAVQESRELKCPKKRLRTFRPTRHGLQVKADLFGG